MEMKNENEVTRFMLYICNRYNLTESKRVFGDNLGVHIYNKRWEIRDILMWYGALDKECRQKLVDRANELYG